MKMRKFGTTVKIEKADWKCSYCPEPLGDNAVGSLAGGYAHRACDPLFQLVDKEILGLSALTPTEGDTTA